MWVDGIFRILARDRLICCSAVEKFDPKIWFCPRSEVAAVTFDLSDNTPTDLSCPGCIIEDRGRRLCSREARDKLRRLLSFDAK